MTKGAKVYALDPSGHVFPPHLDLEYLRVQTEYMQRVRDLEVCSKCRPVSSGQQESTSSQSTKCRNRKSSVW